MSSQVGHDAKALPRIMESLVCFITFGKVFLNARNFRSFILVVKVESGSKRC